jgi:hypothetical protein
MKAPLDEIQLQEACKKIALAYGKIRAYDGSNKLHDWYVVNAPERPGGFMVEFDERGNCVYSTELESDVSVASMATRLTRESVGEEQ